MNLVKAFLICTIAMVVANAHGMQNPGIDDLKQCAFQFKAAFNANELDQGGINYNCALSLGSNQKLLADYKNKNARIWDLATKSKLTEWQAYNQVLAHNRISLSQDGNEVATLDHSGAQDTVKIWGSETQQCTLELKDIHPSKVVFCPDEHTLGLIIKGKIMLLDRRSGKSSSEIQVNFPVYSLAMNQDGRHLVLGTHQYLYFFDMRNTQKFNTTYAHDGSQIEALSFVNQDKFASGAGDGKVKIWNFLERECEGVLDLSHECPDVLALASDQDARELAVCSGKDDFSRCSTNYLEAHAACFKHKIIKVWQLKETEK